MIKENLLKLFLFIFISFAIITQGGCGGATGELVSEEEFPEDQPDEVSSLFKATIYTPFGAISSSHALVANGNKAIIDLPTSSCHCYLYLFDGDKIGEATTDSSGVCSIEITDDIQKTISSEHFLMLADCEDAVVECYQQVNLAQDNIDPIDFGICNSETTLAIASLEGELEEEEGEIVALEELYQLYKALWSNADSQIEGQSQHLGKIKECWKGFVAAGGLPSDLDYNTAEDLMHDMLEGNLGEDKIDILGTLAAESGIVSESLCNSINESISNLKILQEILKTSFQEIASIFTKEEFEDLAKVMLAESDLTDYEDPETFKLVKSSFTPTSTPTSSPTTIPNSTPISSPTTTSSSTPTPTPTPTPAPTPAPTPVDPHQTSSSTTKANSLNSCGSGSVFTTSPLALSDIDLTAGITPLGNLSPSAHTFPTYHMYFMIKDSDGDSIAPVDEVSVYSPGDITITSIASVENITSGKTDYQITFSPCQEIQGYFDHVSTLSSTLQTEFDKASGSCRTYNPGDGDYKSCTKKMNLVVGGGEVIGKAGGTKTNSVAIDFGTRDSRITPLTYTNPDRIYSDPEGGFDLLHVVCPLDYYGSDLKSKLEKKLTRVPEGDPICGQVNQDKIGTAQGKWYVEGTVSPTNDESKHIALVHDNKDPKKPVFSIGNSSLGSGTYYYTPKNTGLVNRDFGNLTADGNIYCYDALKDRFDNAYSNTIFLIKMDSSTLLQIEKKSSASCGEGPWSFGNSVLKFNR